MRARRRQPAPTTPHAPPRAPMLFVHTDEQWEALASEPRQELLQFLGALGPASIAELAHRMNAAPDGLYHHARVLMRAGIIRAVGERHTGRRKEAIYDLAAARLRYDVDIAGGRNLDRLRAMLRSRLAHASKNFDRALASRELRLEEPLVDALIESASSWLDDESFGRVMRHLQSAVQIMASGKRSGRGRLFSLALVLAPLVRSRRGDVRLTKRLEGMRLDAGRAG